MKYEISLNNVKVSKDIPMRWEEVSFKQFLELSKAGNDFAKIISVFTDIEPETLRKAEIKNLDKLLTAITFINTKPEPVIPKEILGYPVPKDLGFESIGQIEDIKDELKKIQGQPIEEQIKLYPLFCAVYACKPYDWNKSLEMQEQFLNAPCLEVLGIGNFTLMKLIGLNLNIGPIYRKPNTRLKKFKQALTVLRVRLVFMLHSFTWKKKQDISVTN
jgi:hypothetical protein